MHVSEEAFRSSEVQKPVQRNFSTVRNQYGGERFGSWCGSRVEARAIGGYQLAREVSRRSEGTHGHDENCEEL